MVPHCDRKGCDLVMAEPAAENAPPVATNEDDKFGPPHAQAVSETLQFWILLPGILLLVAFIGRYLQEYCRNNNIHIVGTENNSC